MINHILPTYCYMLQNKRSHRHSLYSVMSRCIICISNEVEYFVKEAGLQKFHQRRYCEFK